MLLMKIRHQDAKRRVCINCAHPSLEMPLSQLSDWLWQCAWNHGNCNAQLDLLWFEGTFHSLLIFLVPMHAIRKWSVYMQSNNFNFLYHALLVSNSNMTQKSIEIDT